jgi:thiol:disulfide interchange protein
MGRPIITNLRNRQEFANLLQANPGLVIIKFGADWCGPCKMIEQDVMAGFNSMPDNVQCVMVDIDVSVDLYAFLKMKKMVNGVPAILCYKKGNTSFVPDEGVGGADKIKVRQFFQNCLALLD